MPIIELKYTDAHTGEEKLITGEFLPEVLWRLAAMQDTVDLGESYNPSAQPYEPEPKTPEEGE